MSFPTYTTVKESGFAWIGDIPTHWAITPLRHATDCFDGKRVPLNGEQRSAKQGDVPYWGANAIMDYVDEALFNENLVLLGEDGAPFFDRTRQVAFFSSGPVWPNNHIHVLKPKQSIEGKFLTYVLNVTDYSHFIDGSTRDKLTQGAMNQIPLPLPPLMEQKQIVAFLDQETAKIDALINEQKRLSDLLKERITALVLSQWNSSGSQQMRLLEAADLVMRPVNLNTDELFTPLGLFNRGRGLFHKDHAKTDELGASDFYRVLPGDLIISGQFAWEGSVAMAGESEEGCVVSHRYHILRGKPGVAKTEYLFALLLTSHGDFLLNENSRGSAGRNRPLNAGLLLKENIFVPSMDIQEQVTIAVRSWASIVSVIQKQIRLLQERRSALISTTVTGKIDVRGLARIDLPADAEAA